MQQLAMKKPIDQNQRERALDPSTSFIVQAPAGSGKTEILVQRFLRLLSTVNNPEEIIAITFTRKAAAEMRARIISALAQQALPHDQAQPWNLLSNPNRLRIMTIDSLCASITCQIPIMAKFGAQPGIVENAESLYREAAQALLNQLETDQAWTVYLQKLLLHLDNNFLIIENLFVNMLAHREQWLPHIINAKNQAELREVLEQSLQAVLSENMEKCYQSFPSEKIAELVHLGRYAASNLKKEKPGSAIVACEELLDLPCLDLAPPGAKAPAPSLRGLPLSEYQEWLGIANLLLTKDYTWRKQITKNEGFPAKETGAPKELNEQRIMAKQRMMILLDHLSSNEILRQNLQDLIESPPPHYTNSQWEIVDALIELLPILAAQLKLIFQQQGQVDFNEISSAALTALGEAESPTDLALKLDYQIKHILVDEFQDTSITQFRLLEALTAGWQEQDGRTIFLVGDPMQSIYRFRQAEVGLFLAAKKSGLQQIKLESLTLTTNFRASAELVNWLNKIFIDVFPKVEDISSGAISFTPCTTLEDREELETLSSRGSTRIYPHILQKQTGETSAQKIIATIQSLRAQAPDETIAILVRSRSHLIEIIPALKAAGLKFKGVELDRLAECSIIQDLFALTRALLHLADRIAWLAVLRAPWCGLTLADLYIIASKNLDVTLWELLQQQKIINELSADGQKRLQPLLKILTKSLEGTQRQNLRDQIESTWLALAGPACLENETDLDNAKLYFQLLEKIPQDTTDELSWLEQNINDMFAPVDLAADDKLQIMTIHKSKGLEFDHVILPALERKSTADENSLLMWLERPKSKGNTDLIFAPIKSALQEEDSIYKYLRLQEKKKQEFEISRLLYVACTRAKKSLHLLGEIETHENSEVKEPPNNSFLKLLWPSFLCGHPRVGGDPVLYENSLDSRLRGNDSESIKTPMFLKRLKSNFTFPILAKNYPVTEPNPFSLNDTSENIVAQAIGTIIHQSLQRISQNGLSNWHAEKIKSQYPFWKKQLLQLGIQPKLIDEKITIIEQAINNTLNDPRGQWILHPHQAAQSEFPLTLAIENEIKHLIIDRTFIDAEGIRWIIDFKTATPINSNLDNFYTKQFELYQEQLSLYTKAMQNLEQRKIKIGLYFPLFAGWYEYFSSNTTDSQLC